MVSLQPKDDFCEQCDCKTALFTDATGVFHPNINPTGFSPYVAGPIGNIVSINYKVPPTVAIAGTDASICSTVFQLQGNMPTDGIGTWTGAGLTFDDIHDPYTSVSGLSVGVNTITWTIDNGSCNPVSVDTVDITVAAGSVTPIAGINQDIIIDSGTLAATAATGGSWSVVSGAATFVDATDANTAFSGLGYGENVLRWTIDAPCGVAYADVVINQSLAPTIAVAGDNVSIPSTVIQLDANTPVSGIGSWSVAGGTGVFSDASSPTTFVSAMSEGVNTFQWNIISNGFAPSTDTVSITVEADALSPDAGINQDVCVNNSLLNATPYANGYWSVVSGGATIVNIHDAGSAITGLAPGENIFQWNNYIAGETISSDSIIGVTMLITPPQYEAPITLKFRILNNVIISCIRTDIFGVDTDVSTLISTSVFPFFRLNFDSILLFGDKVKSDLLDGMWLVKYEMTDGTGTYSTEDWKPFICKAKRCNDNASFKYNRKDLSADDTARVILNFNSLLVAVGLNNVDDTNKQVEQMNMLCRECGCC